MYAPGVGKDGKVHLFYQTYGNGPRPFARFSEDGFTSSDPRTHLGPPVNGLWRAIARKR